MDLETAPSREEWNKGGGDADGLRAPYTWGHTDLYLTKRDRHRLYRVRGRIRSGRYDDDTTPDSQKGDLQI